MATLPERALGGQAFATLEKNFEKVLKFSAELPIGR
jgi:hypothetical protein